jgi:hypothetical protein
VLGVSGLQAADEIGWMTIKTNTAGMIDELGELWAPTAEAKELNSRGLDGLDQEG